MYPNTKRFCVWMVCMGLALLMVTGLGVGRAQAQDVPPYLTSQGRLYDASSQPITGAQDITFTLYDSDAPGAVVLWSETQTVSLANGFYSVILGRIEPLPTAAFDGPSRYLSVTVGGEELAPWMPLHSVAYALRAADATRATEATRASEVVALDAGGNPAVVLNAAGLSVNGQPVIDASGVWQGQAPSMSYNDLSDRPTTLTDITCTDGFVLKFDASAGTWNCATDDGGTSYQAGTGLQLTGATFSADQATVEMWARGVAFDTEDELTLLLNDDYVRPGALNDGNAATTPVTWDDLTGVPAGFADGVDSVLDEATVDVYVNNNGYALSSNLSNIATSGSWNDLTGIPAGFADGIDNVLDEAAVDAYVNNNGYVRSSDISAVASSGLWGDILGIPAGFADGVDNDTNTTYTAGAGITISGALNAVAANFVAAGAESGSATTVARGDHIHDLRYFTETELSAAGTINTATNPVDWTKLKGVPAGFADGVDNNTTYAAGTAIDITGTTISGAYTAGQGINIAGATISATGGSCYTRWGDQTCAAPYAAVVTGNAGGLENYTDNGGAQYGGIECISGAAAVANTWSGGTYQTRMMRADAQGDGMDGVAGSCAVCCTGGCYTAYGTNTCAAGYTRVVNGRVGGVEAYTGQHTVSDSLCIDVGVPSRFNWASGYNTRLMRHRNVTTGGSTDGMEQVTNTCAVCCKP